MIQDQLKSDPSNQKLLRMHCYFCENPLHLISQCPLIHFYPDRERVIKAANFSHSQQRISFQRNRNRNKKSKWKVIKKDIPKSFNEAELLISEEHSTLRSLKRPSKERMSLVFDNTDDGPIEHMKPSQRQTLNNILFSLKDYESEINNNMENFDAGLSSNNTIENLENNLMNKFGNHNKANHDYRALCNEEYKRTINEITKNSSPFNKDENENTENEAAGYPTWLHNGNNTLTSTNNQFNFANFEIPMEMKKYFPLFNISALRSRYEKTVFVTNNQEKTETLMKISNYAINLEEMYAEISGEKGKTSKDLALKKKKCNPFPQQKLKARKFLAVLGKKEFEKK